MSDALLDQTLSMLREENDRLRAQMNDLLRALGDDLVAPVHWRLVAAEQRILGVLLRRGRATKSILVQVLRPGDENYEEACIESHVSKLRKKMKDHGLTIRTERHLGYFVDEPARSEFLRLMLPEGRDVRRAA